MNKYDADNFSYAENKTPNNDSDEGLDKILSSIRQIVVEDDPQHHDQQTELHAKNNDAASYNEIKDNLNTVSKNTQDFDVSKIKNIENFIDQRNNANDDSLSLKNDLPSRTNKTSKEQLLEEILFDALQSMLEDWIEKKGSKIMRQLMEERIDEIIKKSFSK